MVKLIMGLSGSGKTKTLISLVSEAIEKEQGNVVCIEKSRHLTYDIPYQARLIRTDDYGVRGNTMLLGFLCGLHAGNYDITHFFIDDLNKILDDRSNEALEKFLDTLSAFGERENINFINYFRDDKLVQQAISDMEKLMAARQQSKEQERSNTKKSVLDALRSLKAKKQEQSAQEQDKPKKAKTKGMEL